MHDASLLSWEDEVQAEKKKYKKNVAVSTSTCSSCTSTGGSPLVLVLVLVQHWCHCHCVYIRHTCMHVPLPACMRVQLLKTRGLERRGYLSSAKGRVYVYIVVL